MYITGIEIQCPCKKVIYQPNNRCFRSKVFKLFIIFKPGNENLFLSVPDFGRKLSSPVLHQPTHFFIASGSKPNYLIRDIANLGTSLNCWCSATNQFSGFFEILRRCDALRFKQLTEDPQCYRLKRHSVNTV